MTGPRVVRSGLVPYLAAWQTQRDLHAQRAAGLIGDTVLLLEHPSTFTAGKRTQAWERPTDAGTSVIDVDRGGHITWHGPGQLVGYPILKLADPIDVVAYVRRIEEMLMEVCGRLGVDTIRIPGRSGVWVTEDARGPNRKVAAIGIRVSRAVTLHGFALNCNPDMSNFGRIVPCGIADAGVTSLSAELERDVSVDEVLPLVEAALPTLVALAPA